MRATSAQTVAPRSTSASKAVRRSPANWVGSHPRRTVKRAYSRDEEPAIVRFPSRPEPVRESQSTREEQLANRARQVQSSWSAGEREQRRLAALDKQGELLALIADIELEDSIRLAVADGEQPVMLSEI